MKKLAIALTTLSLLAAGVGGASAASYAYTSMGDCDALKGSPESWDTTRISDRLKEDGVPFSEIDTFGNCFKVMVLNSDGTKSVQLYDPSTLNLIHM